MSIACDERSRVLHFRNTATMNVQILAAFVALIFSNACFAQSAASVVFANGNAQILGRDGTIRTAARGGELAVGETIETTDGRVQLRFHDGANMSLQPATRFRVDEFRFSLENGKASADDRGFFSLLKGGLRTITGLIGKGRQQQYKVDTAVATIGIRGTEYGAKLNEAGLELSTFQGMVELCNNAGCALVAPGEIFTAADRNSLPRKLDKNPEDGIIIPLTPSLPPPKPVESPELTLPAPASNITQPTPGPSYSPPTGGNH